MNRKLRTFSGKMSHWYMRMSAEPDYKYYNLEKPEDRLALSNATKEANKLYESTQSNTKAPS